MARKASVDVDMGAIFSQRNAALAKSAKTDPTLRQFKHKRSPLTGRYATVGGKTYREVRHPEHGVYWTVKHIAGLDKPVNGDRPAPTVNASTAPSIKLELLRMQLQLLSKMEALLA